MQKNTRKRAPILCACGVIVVVLLYLALILSATAGEPHVSLSLVLFIGIISLGCLAIIIGVVAALRQRMKEIDKGEEEDARQY